MVPPHELGGAIIDRKERDGATWITFKIPNTPLFVPTLLITDKWAIVGTGPGAAQSFVKRESGKVKSWEPGPEHQAAFAMLPTEYSSVTMADPRPSYEQLMGFLPMGYGLLQNMALPEMSRELGVELEMPFDISDLPVAAEVTESMFPNVGVGVTNATGCELLMRNSVPSNPMGSVGATAAVGSTASRSSVAQSSTGESESWLPIGTYAVSTTKNAPALQMVQLVVDRQGTLRGVYYDSVTDTTHNLLGEIDSNTQIAKWQLESNAQISFHAPLNDLTQPTGNLQVNMPAGAQQWLLARVAVAQ